MICARGEIRRNWSEHRETSSDTIRISLVSPGTPVAAFSSWPTWWRPSSLFNIGCYNLHRKKKKKKNLLLRCVTSRILVTPFDQKFQRRGKGKRYRETNKWLCWLLETRFFWCFGCIWFFFSLSLSQSSNHHPLYAFDICEYLRTYKLVRDRITRFPVTDIESHRCRHRNLQVNSSSLLTEID